jgi:hypothetical protein
LKTNNSPSLAGGIGPFFSAVPNSLWLAENGVEAKARAGRRQRRETIVMINKQGWRRVLTSDSEVEGGGEEVWAYG